MTQAKFRVKGDSYRTTAILRPDATTFEFGDHCHWSLQRENQFPLFFFLYSSRRLPMAAASATSTATATATAIHRNQVSDSGFCGVWVFKFLFNFRGIMKDGVSSWIWRLGFEDWRVSFSSFFLVLKFETISEILILCFTYITRLICPTSLTGLVSSALTRISATLLLMLLIRCCLSFFTRAVCQLQLLIIVLEFPYMVE